VIPPGVETVYHFAGEGWVLTRPAIAALLEHGRALGVRVRTGVEARALIAADGGRRVAGVALATGEEIRGDVVVSCVGRWTESLLRPAGIDVPMLSPEPQGSPAVGLVVLTSPARCGRRSVAFADGLVVRPDRGGRLALHSDTHDPRVRYGSADEHAVAGEVLALLRTRVRGAHDTTVEEARVCVRALPADRLPVVGAAQDGLYVVATHSGVTLAPALAELVATEVLGRQEAPALARFRPGRFALSAA
jgi:glycine/D-amino acid oxidase-like deaminating enzyme